MNFSWNDRKILINMITCMEMKSFMPYYALIIMFYRVTLACYQRAMWRDLGGPSLIQRPRLKHNDSQSCVSSESLIDD